MTIFTGEPCPRSSDFLQVARDYDPRQKSPTSHSAVTRSINRLAGIGLVGASTGYGCVFAYHNSISQGWPLAFVAVTFAASLEIAKPQAFAAAISKGREVSARTRERRASANRDGRAPDSSLDHAWCGSLVSAADACKPREPRWRRARTRS